MAYFDRGILGTSTGAETTAKIDDNALSQALVVHSIDPDQGILVSGHDPATATVTLASAHLYDEGDLLAFISGDCDQISVIRAGDGTASKTITHPSGNSSLANCISFLKGNYNCHTSSAPAQNMSHVGSLLAPLSSYAYYIRSSNNIPTLYRKEAGEYSSGNAKKAGALVEGIENISVLYGVDSDNDGIANQYQPASAITLTSETWKNVTSVKLELLARSLNEVAPEPQNYFFAGQKVTPADNFIRRSFTSTIKLRNRI